MRIIGGETAYAHIDGPGAYGGRAAQHYFDKLGQARQPQDFVDVWESAVRYAPQELAKTPQADTFLFNALHFNTVTAQRYQTNPKAGELPRLTKREFQNGMMAHLVRLGEMMGLEGAHFRQQLPYYRGMAGTMFDLQDRSNNGLGDGVLDVVELTAATLFRDDPKTLIAQKWREQAEREADEKEAITFAHVGPKSRLDGLITPQEQDIASDEGFMKRPLLVAAILDDLIENYSLYDVYDRFKAGLAADTA